MTIHIILISLILVAFSRYQRQKFPSFSFWILGIFAVLRYNYGNDYSSYMKWYKYIQNGGSSPYKNEIGFTFLNKVMPSFYLLIAITTIFWLVIVYRLIKNNLEDGFNSIAFAIFILNPYLFLMNLSAIRQCIALCIFIISLKYARDKQFIRYVVLIVLAMLFHSSVFLLMPVYFIINEKEITKSQVASIFLIVVVLLFEGAIVDTMLHSGLDFIENASYNSYFVEGMSNSLRATLLTGIYFVYILMNLKNLQGFRLICGKLYLLGLVFGMLAFHHSMLTRLQMYFDIFSIIAIPSVIQYHMIAEEGRWAKVINLYVFPVVIFAIYVLRYYSFFTNPMWESFTTYQTIFEAIL